MDGSERPVASAKDSCAEREWTMATGAFNLNALLSIPTINN
jgi:hypothetical protein